MLLNVLILTATLSVNVAFSVLVFLKNKKATVNRALSFFVLMVAGWTGSVALAFTTQKLFWVQMSFIFGAFSAAGLLSFVTIFGQKIRLAKQHWLIFLPAGVFSVLIYLRSDLFFSKFKISNGILITDRGGPLYPVLGLYIIAFAIASIVILFKKLKAATGIQKNQLRYLIFGIFSFAALALITNVFLPALGIKTLSGLGPAFSVIMIACTSYAILRYRFLEIRILLETGLSYAVAITSTLVLVAGFKFLIAELGVFSNNTNNAILLVLALLVFPQIKRLFDAAITNISRPTFDVQHSIKDLSANLTRLVDLDKIIAAINDLIVSSLRVKSAAMVIFDKDQTQIYSTRPYPENLKTMLSGGPLFRYLNDFRRPLVVQEIVMMADPARQDNFLTKVASLLSGQAVQVFLPMIHQNKLIGVIALASKISGEAFSVREIDLLEILANQSASAVANGKFYKEIRDLNLNLKNKVSEQTKHLDKLLKVKDDFVKIASHQLRTPTTIVKGMLSMVLDGSLDYDQAKKREYIQQSYVSVQNLERIIHGILGASDLAAGKLLMKFEPTDLKEIIDRLVRERSHLCEQKNLELKCESTGPLPRVSADRLKIQEALANLIDNAIHYTPEGKITVGLEAGADNRWVTCSIKDTGIGIKAEDKNKIFKKFARTEKSTMINPNGSGLGLYLVKQIIDAHHGYIEVESEGENKGSLFKVTIPAHK